MNAPLVTCAQFPGSILFNLHTEQGFPLHLALSMFKDRYANGARVNWFSMYREAYQKGMLTFQINDLLISTFRELEAEYRQADWVRVLRDEAIKKFQLYACLFDGEFASCLTNGEAKEDAIQSIEREIAACRLNPSEKG
jgi:hypothetical protein